MTHSRIPLVPVEPSEQESPLSSLCTGHWQRGPLCSPICVESTIQGIRSGELRTGSFPTGEVRIEPNLTGEVMIGNLPDRWGEDWELTWQVRWGLGSLPDRWGEDWELTWQVRWGWLVWIHPDHSPLTTAQTNQLTLPSTVTENKPHVKDDVWDTPSHWFNWLL